MNGFTLKENKLFKEKYYYTTLKSGLRVTYIPKDLPSKTAFLCCDFGGADVEYIHQGSHFTLPYGTAHFLEHKMFETEDGGDAFSEYDRFGGNANAFTSYENTCYYFSCTDNFFENLDILLKAVSSLHCTDASVEKEKKIIAREITMYEDLPNANLSRNLSKGLYHYHPTVKSISGDISDIEEITKETLYRAYNHFYVPENLSLCVCGDVDAHRLLEYAEKYFGTPSGSPARAIFKEEPKTVKEKQVTQTAILATPLYSIGIKCDPLPHNDIRAQRKATAMRLAISLTFGRASDFYCNAYEAGLINERFYAGFHTMEGASNLVISGSGKQYDLVLEKAVAEIEYRKSNFFTSQQILREKRAAYAESITLFDNAEDLTAAMASTAFLDYDEFDCIEILRDITEDEIKTALCSIDTSNLSLSIIKERT